MTARGGREFVDGPAARGLALLVFIGCVASLAWLHRDDLMPGEAPETVAEDDPAAACIAERSADIARMVEEGMIGEEQAVVFRERAAGMCRDTVGGGGGAPPLPKMAPQ